MRRNNVFETDVSTALFLTTYCCPENGSKGYRVLLVVDNAKSALDEMKWRITGSNEDNDLRRKQLDEWDDKAIIKRNLKILEIPFKDRTFEIIDGIAKELKIKYDFIIGSIDSFQNYYLENEIDHIKKKRKKDKNKIKENKKEINPTTKGIIDEIIETHKMVESLDVFYDYDTGAIKLAGFPYRGAKTNLAEESCIKHLLMFENVHTNCDLSKTNKWFISNCINIVRNHRDQKFEIVV